MFLLRLIVFLICSSFWKEEISPPVDGLVRPELLVSPEVRRCPSFGKHLVDADGHFLLKGGFLLAEEKEGEDFLLDKGTGKKKRILSRPKNIALLQKQIFSLWFSSASGKYTRQASVEEDMQPPRLQLFKATRATIRNYCK